MESLRPGEVVDGRYQIERLLGAGGYGEVYAARHVLMRRPVALKVMHARLAESPEAVKRFEHEARFACHLKHPNTVVYHDFGRDDARGILYLAMEFLEGESLEARLRRDGCMTPEATVEVMEQICGALHEAHEAGLVHRDIKPGNIMLVERGGQKDVVKVIDFGIAKAVKAVQGQDTIDLTDSGTIIGSPSYMSPEQVRNEPNLNAKTDIYALACVVYKMLTGLVPFRGSTAVEVATHHVATAPPPISALTSHPLPPGLDGFLLRALSKKPEARPSDALSFARLLREAVMDRSATAPTLPDPSQGQDPIKPTELMSVVPPSRLPGYQPPASPKASGGVAKAPSGGAARAPSGSGARAAVPPAPKEGWSRAERRRAWLLGALLVAGLTLFVGMAGLVGQQLWAKHRAGQGGLALAAPAPVAESPAPVAESPAPAHEGSAPAHEGSAPAHEGSAPAHEGFAPSGQGVQEVSPPEGAAVGGALGAPKKGEAGGKRPSAAEVLAGGSKGGAPSPEVARPALEGKPLEAGKVASEGKGEGGEEPKRELRREGEMYEVRILLSSCDEVEAIEVDGRGTFCGAKLRLQEGPHTVTLRHQGKTVMRSIHVRADKANYPLSLP